MGLWPTQTSSLLPGRPLTGCGSWWEISDIPAHKAVAAADEVLHRLDELSPTAPRLLHGEGPACWPLIAHAGTLGLPTRIGLEDTIVGPDGSAVRGNAELVRLALQTWRASTAP